jgi:hypothetical protein
MKTTHACGILLAALALVVPSRADTERGRELKVHLAQANNDSPYAFVRARFQPGELADPWAVRFFDPRGTEIPYFVWDSITWRVAREGRPDWGNRFALINHAPGDAAEVVEARGRKLEAAKKSLPELGARLEAEEQAARKAPDSVCAALYLLRHRVPAFGKERITLRIYGEKQVEPRRQQWKDEKVAKHVAIKHGMLELRGLPDELGVAWKGKELFRCAGFDAGGERGTKSHADPEHPFAIEVLQGVVTKIAITARTAWRQSGTMDWQCTYWLFPEGGYVALEGFSISDPGVYLGGPQKLSVWQADGNFTQQHAPSWEVPWWLHQAGEQGFVAAHLFHATPLTIGFGNNPFAVNAEGADRDPKVEAAGNRLTLAWTHRLNDPAIARLMAPQPLRRPGDPPPKNPPKPARWSPKVDWLYRQHVVGVGEKAEAAEAALRSVLGAAAGWLDRPVTEEEVASLMVAMMPRIATSRESAEIGLLKVVPAVLQDDKAALREALRRYKDPVERTDYYINVIRKHVELGGKPSEGRRPNDPDGTPREGWTGNPCYHAALMPCYVRVLEHFEVPFRQKESHEAILRYADFTLELLGGKPTDFDKLNEVCQTEWPSRVVPIIPLMLHAYTLKPEEKYAKAAKMMFGNLMRLVERNPHGYWPTWTFKPKAAPFDTVYNPVGYERGITAFWSDGQLDLIGRETASRFVAAQARWFVFSGQLLDTLEIDNATAIRATQHGGHTSLRNQIGIYLFDDFDFYRGLIADLAAWSAASCQVPGQTDGTGTGAYRSLELSNGGSSMLRWALGIRPGGKWLESRVQPVGKNGFRLQAWNRLPQANPTIKATAKEIGLTSDGEAMQVQLSRPAYRLPAEFETSWTADKLSVKVSQPAKIRMYYRVLRPEWKEKPTLQRRGSGDGTEAIREGVVWKDDYVEWQATPGQYEVVR